MQTTINYFLVNNILGHINAGVGKLFGGRATSLGYELSKGCIF